MPARYLAAAWLGEPNEGFARDIGWRLRDLPSPMRISTVGSMTIAVSGAPALEFPGGTIVGPLFDRHHPQPVTAIDDAEAQRILVSRGQRLIDRYWGGFVAILCPVETEAAILRAPFGELPCYRLIARDAIVCASDIGMLVTAGLLQPQLGWDAVVRELAWRDFRGTETCLAGVEELIGGDRLSIAGRDSRIDTLWSPWDINPLEEGLSSDETLDRIRRQAVGCVNARASSFGRVLLLLSGGLDSSIVAASLAEGRTPFELATMTTIDPLGDEREYANTVADAVGHPVHAACREVAGIDPACPPGARLPRPAGRLFEQETVRIAREIAALTGAQAVLTGGGGDNVFCSLQSAAPVVDRLLAQGPGRGIVDTARDLASVAQASVPAVLWSALARLWNRNRASPVLPDPSFLAGDARLLIGKAPHPWLKTPTGALPGHAAHIKLLATAESFMRGFDPQADLPLVAPLLGQPLVEACLAIPSWRWFSNGCNRAIARQAFSANLPDTVAWRRSKGTPDSFVAEIYERYQFAFRDRLLGGLLAAERLIDTASIDRAFSRTGALVPSEYRRLIRLAEVELWARSWAGGTSPLS